MKSNNPCITATVAEALERLPGGWANQTSEIRFKSVFIRGSVLLLSQTQRG